MSTEALQNIAVNIIGKRGTGKSTLAQALAERHGLPVFRPSDVIRDFARRNDLVLDSTQAYVDAHRLMLAEDVDAVVRPAIKLLSAGGIVIDGMRVIEHVSILKSVCDLRTIALSPSTEDGAVRLERVVNDVTRQDRDAVKLTTEHELLADEKADEGHTDPREPNVGLIMRLADLTIDSLLPPEEIYDRACAYLDALPQPNP